MQRCFGLARLSKNYVNKTSTILFKRANSSITESYTRNGFVDQVLPVRLPSIWKFSRSLSFIPTDLPQSELS